MNWKLQVLIPYMLFSLSGLQSQDYQALPGEHFSRNDKSWYNRKIGITKILIQIQEGAIQEAIDYANQHEGDAEADFLRAIAYAHLGKEDQAISFLDASLKKDLPFGRYLAGDIQLLKPLTQLPSFQKLKNRHALNLVHGPMVGAVTEKSATFWCRITGEKQVEVEVSRTADFRKIKKGLGRSTKEKENTVAITLSGLKANAHYYYRIRIDSQLEGEVYTFSTNPKPGKSGRFSIAFGGGAAYIPWYHHMWSTIHSHRPNALFLLGDNVYIDYPEKPEIQQYCYHRRQSEPHFRKLVGHTPTYAIWDDHDFGDNDEYGTPDPNHPSWKPKVLEVFKNQWVNPGYGGKNQAPGVFFKHSIGDVDFFFLDGRYYRQPSILGKVRVIPISMLGQAQKQWLKNELRQSKATFKVIISPVPWSYEAKPSMEGRLDTWDGYRHERSEVFDFLAQHEIPGVLLLSADRHRSDIWKIERHKGYPLYEFESSKLTNTHTHPIMPEAEFGYNEKCSFGKLVFDTNAREPNVEFQIINIDGVIVKRVRVAVGDLIEK